MHVRPGQSLLAPKPSTSGKAGGHQFQKSRHRHGLRCGDRSVLNPCGGFPGEPGFHGPLRMAISGHLRLESRGRSVRGRSRDLRHLDHVTARVDDRGAPRCWHSHFHHRKHHSQADQGRDRPDGGTARGDSIGGAWPLGHFCDGTVHQAWAGTSLSAVQLVPPVQHPTDGSWHHSRSVDPGGDDPADHHGDLP